MAITLESLDNSIRVMRKDIAGLESSIEDLEAQLTVYVTKADLTTAIAEVNDTITELTSAMATVEEKVANVLLPNDTRFYLKESEITDFRTNFKTLRALLADVEKTRQALIRLMAKYNLANPV